MNAAHLHLLLNHIPVIGLVGAVLILAVGATARNATLVRTSLWTFALLAVAAIAVYLTGESAEEVVEAIPGIGESVIEEHEEFALATTIATGALGALSLLALWLYRAPRTFPQWLAVTALLASLIPAGMLAWTAELGGRIRHEEIRTGWTPPPETAQDEETEEREEPEEYEGRTP